ncbi:hypothetical protein B0F90DRAFT_1747723 [Multifurca ochricompacta]|uniref:Secreted protein n=1 Tax=Multifurca ochricompacta TaxID=376703 RepID=A0AAD4LZA6_9AGAM|nr:hypothetical protein B0F90DRAFT_1747723 [Multifurca ochricompacta]
MCVAWRGVYFSFFFFFLARPHTGSSGSIAGRGWLAWHPCALRVVHEGKLTTRARARERESLLK